MEDYVNHYEKVMNCIVMYQRLANCHLVDFLTENLWTQCLPEILRMQIEKTPINYIECNEIENTKCMELDNFIKYTKSLTLEKCPSVLSKEMLWQELSESRSNEHEKKLQLQCSSKAEFMNEKKVHEVEALGEIVGKIADSMSGLVIDAGAGKAYLSTHLSEKYGLPVLAVDSSNVCHQGAINRQEKMKKKKQHTTELVQYIVEKIGTETDYRKMVNMYFPTWNVKQNLILTGLHTCGDLVHSMMKTFIHVNDVKVLCVVPCCYHLLTKSFTCTFSKNARMLAQQSVQRNIAKNRGISISLFYRAVLQVLLRSKGIDNARIGRGAPLDDFPTYAKWALLKIGLNVKDIPPDTALQQLYNEHADSKWKLEVFQTLRIYLAPVLEAAIILNNIIFLRQNCKQLRKSIILRLFDPVLSPRHYAIIAMK